ncbi:hypothetical protein [Marinithermus hydrothermalis]|uniref:Uncharacterized protein n=1 Tax=Marinithermus hydrothermalis (strain DSM 14884 / JCM 11576 / T1) TaxID=869210 RepID=F2NKN9_MARHT|nr:hypothetical protein [Marinithermus hydrothermalis]AEB10802.1 hypothetical protein Marky_0037 [Marinithermus hydrothermalis DSM 14884]
MTPAALALLRLVLWLLPFLLGYLAARSGRGRVFWGLVLAGALLGLAVRPFPLGIALLALGLLAGYPLGRKARG